MKFKTILLIGCAVYISVSCGTDLEAGKQDAATDEEVIKDPIINNWQLDSTDFSAGMEGIPKEARDQLKAELEKEADQNEKVTFDIQKGGKIEVTTPDRKGGLRKSNGTWKLSKNSKTLTIDIDGHSDEFTVEELTTDKLCIVLNDKIKMIFTPKK